MERREAVAKLKTLAGVELHQLAQKYGVTVTKDEKINKGWAGHVLERFLELPINSAQSPNFGSWELKSVPLRKLKTGKLSPKETMAITMIDPINVQQKPFAESHLLAKLQKAVIVFRSVGDNALEPSYVHSVVEFDLNPNNELYSIIQCDYDIVRQALLDSNGDLGSLSSSMGKFIQPRTKGPGHGSKSRAFYARTKFLKVLLNNNLSAN